MNRDEVRLRAMEITIKNLETELARLRYGIQDTRQGRVLKQTGDVEIQGKITYTNSEFKAGNNVPLGEGFTGTIQVYPPITVDGYECNYLVLKSDVLQFGVTSDGDVIAAGGAIVLNADGSKISGWDILPEELSANNAHLMSDGILRLGTSTDIIELNAIDGTYRIWAGAVNGVDAPFSVTKKGAIKSILGQLGNWTISDTTLSAPGMTLDAANSKILVGSSGSPAIEIDGLNERMRSKDYAAGVSGFNIDSNLIEANNLKARGMIEAMVMAYKSVQASGGTSWFSKSAGKLKTTFTSVAPPAHFDIEVEDAASGHYQIFTNGDDLLIKSSAGIENWLHIEDTFDMGEYWKYECSLPSVSGSPQTVETFSAGAPIVDIGQAGDGIITISCDNGVGYSPNITMSIYSGMPGTLLPFWRGGNLNGFLDYITTSYGLGIGDADNFLSYDQVNKLRLKFGQYGINIGEKGLDLPVLSVSNPAYIAGRITFTKPGDSIISGCIWPFYETSGSYEALTMKIFAAATDNVNGGVGQVYIGSAMNTLTDKLFQAYTRYHGTGTAGYIDNVATLERVLKDRFGNGGDLLVEGGIVSGSPAGVTEAGTFKTFDIASAPTTFAEAGTHVLYSKSDGYYHMDSAGNEYPLGGVQTGATVPASPYTGQFFLHTPTGRTVLLQYSGAAWKPIKSYGTVTVYVDSTDGTDAVDQGGAVDVGAYKTIQYAIDQLAPLADDNITVNINAETYAETVTIPHINFAAGKTLTVQGTLSANATYTDKNGTQGSGATQGSVAIGADKSGKLIVGTSGNNNGVYRLCDAYSNPNQTICGTWTGSLAATDDWAVYDWGTIISRIDFDPGAKAVVYDCSFSGASTFSSVITSAEDVEFYRCYFSDFVLVRRLTRYVLFDTCYITNADNSAIRVNYNCYGYIYRSKIVAGSTSYIALDVRDMSMVTVEAGTICRSGSSGIATIRSSQVLCNNVSASGYIRVTNNTYGITANTGGQVTGTANNYYNSNATADESATAASYGYID
jgi:hypothetical protein